MGLIGIIDVVSAVTPPERYRLRYLVELIPAGLVHVAAAVTAVLGVLLTMLARGLRRRKRRAWIGTTALVAVSVGLHLVKGLDIEEASASLLLLMALVVTRTEFVAQGDPRSRWRAPVVAGQLLVFDVILGTLLLAVAPDRVVTGNRSLSDTVRTVLRGLVGLDGPLGLHRHRGATIGDILLALGAFTALIAVYLLLRAPKQIRPLGDDDLVAMRGLLSKNGAADSLGYFALRHDKSVAFSPSAKSAVAYRVVAGCLLASGDPLGNPEAWPGAISACRELASRHGWILAAVGCSEVGALAWRKHAGFDALEVGDEAVVHVLGHPVDGLAIARAERAGYDVRVRRTGDLDEVERTRLTQAAATWCPAGAERGFSMALGRLGEPADDTCVVVTAELGGQLQALAHLVPWGPDGLSLDLIRHSRSCADGLSEVLIQQALTAAPLLGVQRISLNFTIFRAALDRGQRIGAGLVLRRWTAVLLLASRWLQIESRHRFRAAFDPEWEPRFLCYENARDLARIGVACLQAEAFLTRSAWWQR